MKTIVGILPLTSFFLATRAAVTANSYFSFNLVYFSIKSSKVRILGILSGIHPF